MGTYKLLVVDDFKPFLRFVSSTLEQDAKFQIVGQAYDGLEAIQKAEELQPDLILCDVGLPKLNGIEAARRLRKLVPHSKILFLSQESSPDVVREALRSGALGYVHKMRARSELLPAVEAVLQGKQFVGRGLEDCGFACATDPQAPPRHEVQFYDDDAVFAENFARVIAPALAAGNAAVVIATRSHLEALLQRLTVDGLDMDSFIQKGAYLAVDAAGTLSAMMVDGVLDPVRFFEASFSLIDAASRAATAKQPRVTLCGERVGLLWAEGKTDEAIRLEQLCNELVKMHEVDMLCAYPSSSFHDEQEEGRQRVCAEHSFVSSR